MAVLVTITVTVVVAATVGVDVGVDGVPVDPGSAVLVIVAVAVIVGVSVGVPVDVGSAVLVNMAVATTVGVIVGVGVGVLGGRTTAAAASTRPYCQYVPVPSIVLSAVAIILSITFTLVALVSHDVAHKRAATPDTCGAAIDVPVM